MDILNAYRAVADKHGLPQLTPGGYKAESRSLATPDEAWNQLTALVPHQGWLLFQSAQMPFMDGLPERQPDWGVPLAAEAYAERNGAAISIALEQDGRGSWTLTTYTHEGEGDALCDETAHLAHNHPGATGPNKLNYRRYWRYDQRQGYVQAVACLIGFKQEKAE